MADTSNLTRFLGDVADSIRLKKGTTEPIQPKDFDTEISTIDTSGLNTYDATATENDIVADKTAYANGEKITGTVTDNRGTIDEPKTVTLGDKTVTYTNSDNGYGGYMRIEMTPDKASVIDNTSKVTTDVLGKVIADNVGLTPDVLADGVTLLGVEGTHLGRDDIIYTELEYIESTGTQYIDTEYIPTSTTKWVYDYQFLSDKNYAGAENAQNGCGYWSDTERFVIGYGEGQFNTNIGTNAPVTVNGDTERHTFILDAPNKKGYIDDIVIECNYSSYSTDDTICFFTRNEDASTSKFMHSGRFYGSQIYNNSILIRDFIPVLDENGVACLYDKVTKKFFYNKGTGSFTAGPTVGEDDYSHIEIEYILSTGTQYIDTGYIPKQNSRFELDLKDENSTVYESYFGNQYVRLIRSSSSNLDLLTNDGNTIFSCSLTARRTLIINNTGVYDQDMNLLSASGNNFTIEGDTKSVLLFLSYYNNNLDVYGRYYNYGFKIYEGDVLVHSFKPVLDESNVACMFDEITQTYFYNKGTGSFTAGPVV